MWWETANLTSDFIKKPYPGQEPVDPLTSEPLVPEDQAEPYAGVSIRREQDQLTPKAFPDVLTVKFQAAFPGTGSVEPFAFICSLPIWCSADCLLTTSDLDWPHS